MSNHRVTRLEYRAFQRQALPPGPTSQLAKHIYGDIAADEFLGRYPGVGGHVALRRTMVSKLDAGELKVRREIFKG